MLIPRGTDMIPAAGYRLVQRLRHLRGYICPVNHLKISLLRIKSQILKSPGTGTVRQLHTHRYVTLAACRRNSINKRFYL